MGVGEKSGRGREEKKKHVLVENGATTALQRTVHRDTNGAVVKCAGVRWRGAPTVARRGERSCDKCHWCVFLQL